MKKIGNPYEDEICEDEDEYLCLNRMCTLYEELLIVFFSREYKSFIGDATIIHEKSISDNKPVVLNKTLGNLISRFVGEIIPNLTEPHLIARCKEIGFDYTKIIS